MNTAGQYMQMLMVKVAKAALVGMVMVVTSTGTPIANRLAHTNSNSLVKEKYKKQVL